jgi:hypothetical protein
LLGTSVLYLLLRAAPPDPCDTSLFPNPECLTSPTFDNPCLEGYIQRDWRCPASPYYIEACDTKIFTYPSKYCFLDPGYVNATTSSGSGSTVSSGSSSDPGINYCDTNVYPYPDTRCIDSPTYFDPCDTGYGQYTDRCTASPGYIAACDYTVTGNIWPNLSCEIDKAYFVGSYCSSTDASWLQYCPTHPTWQYPCADGYTQWVSRCSESASYIAECDYTNAATNPGGYLSYPNIGCSLDYTTRRLR